MFFYHSDYQETDIEILTHDGSVWLNNQATSPSGKESFLTQNLPPDAATTFHEYRLDWVPRKTQLYIDGVLQFTQTENVPSSAGPWLWNNWR